MEFPKQDIYLSLYPLYLIKNFMGASLLMDQTISYIVDIMTYISSLGNVLMMPLVFTGLCLVFGMNLIDAVRHSVKVGIGFIGFNMVNAMVISKIGPAVTSMAQQRGMHLDTLDLGWPAVSTIAYATELGALIVVLGLLFNVLLILLRLVKTLDVDLWNYWQWALTGSFVMLLTGSFSWGLIAALIHELITLFIADASAKMIQEYIHQPNISISHAFATIMWLMAWPITKFWEMIGWKEKKSIKEPTEIGKKISKLLDPVIIGLVIGLGIGALGYAGTGLGFKESFRKILDVGMAAAGVLILMPKAVSVLLEGINPISAQARMVLEDRLAKSGRELYIGVDSAVMAQDEMILIASVLLIPVALLMAPVLPGNKLIPFGGITSLVYNICMIAPLVKGDFLKLFVTSAILLAVLMILGSNWAPQVTALVGENGLAMPTDGASVSFLANPITWIMVVLAR
jgi:galactitol PTS system EIIC component